MSRQLFDHAGYQRRRYATRRADAINVLGGRCTVCGSTDPDDLEFRQLPGHDRPQPVARLFPKYSWDAILDELAHFHLLCRTCHVEGGPEDPSLNLLGVVAFAE